MAMVFQLTALVLSGLLIGRLLDNLFGTFPLLHILFLVAGLSIGVYRMLEADRHKSDESDTQ
jgi:F0F1-type ATP synthase assembly protein I